MKQLFKQILKYVAMIPIFFFIGCGVLISLDIIQPSMFRDLSANAVLLIIAAFVGSAPIFLITEALNNLLAHWRSGAKSALYVALAITGIFMIGEIVYSYISIEGFFTDSKVPLTKIIGIMFLPFTFSLFYFTSLFTEKKPEKAQAVSLPNPLLEEREKIIQEIIMEGSKIASLENHSNEKS